MRNIIESHRGDERPCLLKISQYICAKYERNVAGTDWENNRYFQTVLRKMGTGCLSIDGQE